MLANVSVVGAPHGIWTAPDGIYVDMYGPVPGRRHDLILLQTSRLMERLIPSLDAHKEALALERPYIVYGDGKVMLRGSLPTSTCCSHV